MLEAEIMYNMCFSKRNESHYFKYKSLSGNSFRYFVQMLMDEKIHSALFNMLNDPMEGVFLSSETLSDTIKRCVTDKKSKKRIISMVKAQTPKPCNMLMWSHYADEHKGCCIEFHFKNSEDEKRVKEVSYISEIKDFENSKDIDIDIILSSKFKEWSYENEVRHIGDEEFVPIIIDKIFIGMRVDNMYDHSAKHNGSFYKNLINKLSPSCKVEYMKAEDFDKKNENI